MATYLSAFQAHLEDLMRTGGSPEDMQACVDQYNDAGLPDFSGGPAFSAWVTQALHTCSSCHKTYRIEAAKAEEQTCSECEETKP